MLLIRIRGGRGEGLLGRVWHFPHSKNTRLLNSTFILSGEKARKAKS